MEALDFKLTEVKLVGAPSFARRGNVIHLVRTVDNKVIWTIGPEVQTGILDLTSRDLSMPILEQMLNLKICSIVAERLDSNLFRFRVDEEFCLVESKPPLSRWVSFKFIPPSPEAFLLAESICKTYADRRKWVMKADLESTVGLRNYAAAQALEIQASFIGLEKAFKRIGGIL